MTTTTAAGKEFRAVRGRRRAGRRAAGSGGAAAACAALVLASIAGAGLAGSAGVSAAAGFGGAPAFESRGAILSATAAVSAPAAVNVAPGVETAQAAGPLSLMMLVACVEAGGEGSFHLTGATDPEPITDQLPPRPEASAALGRHRIRLIGTLEEFGVARLVGHKVWAKGLLIEDASERRLNLVSITRLSPDCE